MPYLTDTYSTLKNLFLDWLTDVDNTGNNTADIALSRINRAQQNLWHKKFWDGLVKEGSLTASATAQSLPSDWGKTLRVGYDSDNDGRIDYDYYENNVFTQNGYKIRNAFTKASGHVYTIEFYQAPSTAPKIYYQMLLADFTGSGTEYLYFPMDLMLAEAKLIHLRSAPVDGELSVVQAERDELLYEYIKAHQYQNRDMKKVQLDNDGLPITTVYSSLDGGEGELITTQDNDFDLG